MRRRKSNSDAGLGCLYLVILVVGTNYLFAHPFIFYVFIAALIGFGILAVLNAKPNRCEICGNLIQRKSYIWAFGDGAKKICPECNQTMRRRNSRNAMR